MKTINKFLFAVIIIMSCKLNAQVSVPFRVNVGGAQTTSGGKVFGVDQYSTGGTPYNSSNTSLDLLYRSERYGNFSYDIPIENGYYDIVLHFMEIFMSASGQRIFDVKIEGNLVINNYDIYQEVGVVATTKPFYNVQVNDGVLNLVFTNIGSGGEIGNPKLSGFEVLPIQAPTTPILSMTSKTDTTVDLSWTASTDNIGVVGYKVYKSGVLDITLGNILSYQVTGLNADTAYDFTVTAFDAQNNESALSNVATVTTNASSAGGGGYWILNDQDVYYNNGNVGIGTSITDSKLTVKGSIHSEEVKVDLSVPAPDYVFKSDYHLTSFDKLRDYIITYGHLPNIPSAKNMEANGIELGLMNMKLLEKIEELTLYILEIEKRLKEVEVLLIKK